MKGPGTRVPGGRPDRTRFRLQGRSITLDKRIHAVRGDLADISLAGTLFSAHYARAAPMHCVMPGASLYATSTNASASVSQLLRGEIFQVLDMTTEWAWGFCAHDGYVGYVRREALDLREQPTHRITARLAPVFAAPDIKSRIVDYWPAGAQFAATVEGGFLGCAEGGFLGCAEGFVHGRHAAAADIFESDWVDVASRYLGAPYVWGGRGHGGVDCSGLVQVALGLCGRRVPRDSDLQREGIGSPIGAQEDPKRGDFLFFPGHVGIMADDMNLLHANAHWMETVIEPLCDVVARLGHAHDRPILARRRIHT